MSHELRTPLNAILGFAQLLELEQLTADQREFVTQIRTGGRHLLGLVSEVLDVSRIESGTLTLSLEPVSVADAVDEALDLVRNQAAAAGVTVRRVRTAPTVPHDAHVLADRQRLVQVLVNLLSNGVKYNHDGGSVELDCEQRDPDLVAIRVTDTGRGLHPDHLDRFFEPFDRLGAEQSTIEGTGIGLTLSRGLADAMAGRIEVESVLGEGSVFSLVLPRSQPVADDLATAEVRGPTGRGSRRGRALHRGQPGQPDADDAHRPAAAERDAAAGVDRHRRHRGRPRAHPRPRAARPAPARHPGRRGAREAARAARTRRGCPSSWSRPTPPPGSTTGFAPSARMTSSPSRSTSTTCSPGSTGRPRVRP